MRGGPFAALVFVLVLTLSEGQDQLEGEKVARFKKVREPVKNVLAEFVR